MIWNQPEGAEVPEDRILTCQKTDTDTYEWAETAPNWRKSVADTLTNGLVGHWTFNETETNFAYDYSGQGNTGRSFGPYLDFNQYQADYVDITYSSTWTAFTIEGWIYKTVQESGHDGILTSNSFRYQTVVNGDNTLYYPYITFTTADGGGTCNASYLSMNAWHHIAVAVNGTTVETYTDGTLDNTCTSGDGSYDITALRLGADGLSFIGGLDHMSGRLDDVRIYNRALSATEIEQLYEGRFTDTTGLVGHWKMDEGTDGTCAGGLDVCDHSGNENHGNNVGATWQTGTAPTRTAVGSGYAATFDGVDDYVEAPDDASLDMGTGDLTISAWVKSEINNEYQGILGKITVESSDYRGYTIRKGTNDYFEFFTGGSPDIYLVKSDSTYTDSNWHHVLGTRRNGKNYIYVDGVEQTQTANSVLVDSEGDVSIGKIYSNHNDYYFNGQIDDVRIYNRALSEDEVKYLYETTYRE
jgi:hypothetical protein